MKNKIITSIILAGALVLGAASCTNHNQATNKEAKVSRAQLGTYLDTQPVPAFKSSQLRQNLIEIETAQANTTATTSFMFNQGVADPITVCPSIGYPIPASYQLTNPVQRLQDHDSVVNQLEATGVYTGDTTGTYVICVNDEGKAYAQYWEGFVSTVTGPATWDADKHQVVLTGAPSADFTGQDG